MLGAVEEAWEGNFFNPRTGVLCVPQPEFNQGGGGGGSGREKSTKKSIFLSDTHLFKTLRAWQLALLG